MKFFFVPADYWYSEKEHFNEIKNLKENSGISENKIEQINKLLSGYQAQIEFRKKKIKIKQLMIEKYNTAKQQLNLLIADAIKRKQTKRIRKARKQVTETI